MSYTDAAVPPGTDSELPTVHQLGEPAAATLARANIADLAHQVWVPTVGWDTNGVIATARITIAAAGASVPIGLSGRAGQFTPITFAAVARAASVSTWLAYAEGVREHIDAAQKRQAAQPLRDPRAGLSASAASLRTDLELARQEITSLRAERDTLRAGLRTQLGRQLDQLTHRELVTRIDELTRHNQRLADDNRQLAADNQQLQQQAAELEGDLAASRASLRRMIRDTNQQPETP